ncbi:Ubiquitin carboxyl-terminal hydrolase 17-like protein 22 [Sciurus carolinensis]|uniref:Ubiquitin carboxyl-terminal hydrolase 17-like protein 22 n=1 Tax=Sciurus carolinensis TaxID=30640 RepID=A0AA41STH6_SCICA|nr:Ubiquitin carboxyl-terminal hydrolase 17-like protein 22 [Sciurus carolinensis]
MPACKTLSLQTASRVLMLVLKPFSVLTGDKIAKQVHYPECLDMQPYMAQQSSGPLACALYAMLVHAGKNELEPDSGSVSLDREPRALGPEVTVLGAAQGELQGDSCSHVEENSP